MFGSILPAHKHTHKNNTVLHPSMSVWISVCRFRSPHVHIAWPMAEAQHVYSSVVGAILYPGNGSSPLASLSTWCTKTRTLCATTAQHYLAYLVMSCIRVVPATRHWQATQHDEWRAYSQARALTCTCYCLAF